MHKLKLGLLLSLGLFMAACTSIKIFEPTPTIPIDQVLAPVLNGDGVPGSGIYQLDDSGPHKVIVLNQEGDIYQEWQDQLPTSWVASSLEETEFVIQVSENLVEDNDETNYSITGPIPVKITFFLEVFEVTAWEAMTGNKLWEGYILIQEDSLEARVDSLAAWLACRVNSQSCDRIVLTGHTERISSVAISPNDEIVASGSWDDTIILWRAFDGAMLHHLRGHSESVFSIAFSPDSSTLASCDAVGQVILWDVESGEKLNAFQAHETYTRGIAISPEGKYLATGASDETVKIWDPEGGNLLKSLDACSVRDIEFSMNGDILAAGCGDEQMMFWNVGEFNFKASIDTGALVQNLVLSANGEVVAAALGDQRVKVWRIDTGIVMQNIDLHNLPSTTGQDGIIPNDLVFTPDEEKLWIGVGLGSYSIWEYLLDGQYFMKSLSGHQANVENLAISSDGSLLVSGSEDGVIRLWRDP